MKGNNMQDNLIIYARINKEKDKSTQLISLILNRILPHLTDEDINYLIQRLNKSINPRF